MEQEIVTILAATQSPDQRIRESAEHRINDLQASQADNLVLSLISIASSSYALSIQQSALLTLKFTIPRNWSAHFEEFVGTALSWEVKSRVRRELFRILASPQSKLRSLAANIISKISSADFPDEWPELFDEVMTLLKSSQEESVHCALLILQELFDDGLTFEQFSTVAVPVFDSLRNLIITSSISYSTRAGAVDTARAALNFFNQSQSGARSMTSFIKTAVDIWSGVFSTNLSLPMTSHSGGDQNGLLRLRLSSVKAIQQLNSTFPSETEPYIFSRLFQAVWNDLIPFAEVYESFCVKDDADDSTIELEYVKSLPIYEMEFVRQCLSNQSVRDFMHTGNNLTTLIALCITMGQISVEEESDWTIDENSFITEELSLSTKYTCRTATSDLLLEVSDYIINDMAEALRLAAVERSKLDIPTRWRQLESAMFLIETVLVQDVKYGRNLGESGGIDELLNLVLAGMSSPNHWLRARSYILGGTLCRNVKDFIPPALANDVFNTTLNASSSDSNYIVRACCLLACQRFLSVFPHKHSKATQMALVKGVMTLVADATDETPSLLVDTLEAAIKISPDLAVLPESQIIQLLFQVAAKDASNVQLSTDTFEAFEYLAENISPGLYQELCQLAIPPLVSSLSMAPTDSEVANATLILNLLSILVDHAPLPLPSGLVDFVFPKVANILLVSTDNQLLQYGSEFVAHVIQHDSSQLRDWRDSQGKSGVEVVLNIVARLLSPAVDESSAMCIGEVVTEVVDKFGNDLGDLLGQLLLATAERLHSAQNPFFVQNLIMVFAHMAAIDPHGVVEFLSTVQLPPTDGLTSVLTVWLSNFDVFKGYKEIRLNILALGRLYMLHDPRIESIVVPGDLIVEDSGVILTRSQAKKRPYKYTTVPAHVKIVKLLLKELSSHPALSKDMNSDPVNTTAGKISSSEQNDEWEDDYNADDAGSNDFFDEDDGDAYFAEDRGGDDESNHTLADFFKSLCEVESDNLDAMSEKYFSKFEKDTIRAFRQVLGTIQA